jgi:hypothetical protein
VLFHRCNEPTTPTKPSPCLQSEPTSINFVRKAFWNVEGDGMKWAKPFVSSRSLSNYCACRFYGVDHATSHASRTSVGTKRTLPSDTRRHSTVRDTSISTQQKCSHPHGGIAKLYQSYRQCWRPRAPIVSLSSDKGQTSVSKYPGGPRAKYQPRSSSSGIIVPFAASNPITQLKEQWQSRNHAEVGRPALISSAYIVQASNSTTKTA